MSYPAVDVKQGKVTSSSLGKESWLSPHSTSPHCHLASAIFTARFTESYSSLKDSKPHL